MKNISKKNIVLILAVVALICLSAATLILGNTLSSTAYITDAAEEPANAQCDGSHTGYTAFDVNGGNIGTVGTPAYYFLEQDIKLSGPVGGITVSENTEVTICLNGHMLFRDGQGGVITVKSGAKLTVCDCKSDSAEEAHKNYYKKDAETGLWKFTDDGGNFLTSDAGVGFVVGGVIAGGEMNASASDYGAGIRNEGTLTLAGGTVAGNSGGQGGGVCNIGTFIMTGGAISGNISLFGGGVGNGVTGAANPAEFTVCGGKITDNNASDKGYSGVPVYGGGVYNKNGIVQTSGNPVIDGNQILLVNGTSTVNNIYLTCDAADENTKKIIVNGKLTDGAKIGFTSKNAAVGGNILSNYSAFNAGVNPNEFFFDDGLMYAVDGEGKLTVHNHDGVDYKVLPADGGHIGVEGQTSYYHLAGNLKLKNNIVIISGATVILCLNGYVLQGVDGGSIIKIDGSAQLTIKDCKNDSTAEEHKHYYNKDATGLWKFADENGTLLTSSANDDFIVGGVITGGYVDSGQVLFGGAVTVGRNSTLNLTGGAICGNRHDLGPTGSGSGYGGGIVSAGTVNMSGGRISGNIASHGGGVYADMGTFLFSSGIISDNFASNDGGGVYIDYIDSVEISGGIIQNNSASGTKREGYYKAGGISIIAMSADALKISGNPKIIDNYYINNDVNTVEACNLHNRDNSNNNVVINISGELTAGAKIGVTCKYSEGYVITNGYGTHNPSADASAYLFSDLDYCSLYLNDGGEVAITDVWTLTLNLYKDDGGNYVVDDTKTFYNGSVNENLTRITPVREGYVFGGWYNNETFTGAPVTEIPAKSHGQKTFYAKWTLPDEDLFGDNIKFGAYNLWDCQRNPAFPLGNTPFYIFGLNTPLDVRGNQIVLSSGDYVRFVPYSGDGATVTDKDNNNVITVSELAKSDRDRIVNSLCGSTNSTSEKIDSAVVVSEIKYDGSGNATVLANIGLIWALDEIGFLYTALDPDCGWSYSGGVGTFITFDAHKAGDSVQYVPASSDPVGKDDLTDDGDNKIVPVPRPDVDSEPTVNTYSLVGIVVDKDGNALSGAEVTLNSVLFTTDTNGYFVFDSLSGGNVTVKVSYGGYGEKEYAGLQIPTKGTVRLVYPLNSSENGVMSENKIHSITYMNMDGAVFSTECPLYYTEGEGITLPVPAKTCHIFEGWYENPDFSGSAISGLSPIRFTDIVVYAKWSEKHDWNSIVWTWADDGSSASAQLTCKNDSTHVLNVDAANITSEITTPATCKQTGVRTYTATITVDGMPYTSNKEVEIPTTAHNYGDPIKPVWNWSAAYDQVTVTFTCKVCGEQYSETLNSNRISCSATAPDCVTPGHIIYSASVTFNGENFTDRKDIVNKDIPALGHDWNEGVVTKEPTCTENGEATYTCNRCGVTKTEDVSATGHNFGDWTVTKQPTCTEAGEETRVCSKDPKHKETRAVSATGHDYGDWTVTKQPTCTEAGEETRVCAKDPKHTETRPISATGHNFGDWTVTKQPTCTEAGEETRVCTNDPTHTETRPISATGHNYGDWTVTKQPTCTEAGEETRVCANDSTHTETREVSAVGHSWGEWTVTKPATEESDGVETRTCSVCGATETRPVKYVAENKSLLWLIILLAVILAVECVVLIVRIYFKKQKSDNVKLGALLPILAVVYPQSEIVAISVLAAAIAAVGVAIACTFINKKDNKTAEPTEKDDEAEDLKSERNLPAEEPQNFENPKNSESFEKSENSDTSESVENSENSETAENSDVSENSDNSDNSQNAETAASDGENSETAVSDEADSNLEEEQELENEVAAEFEKDEKAESQNLGISLKESLALAAAHAQIKINKTSVAEWLTKNYGEEILINRRANRTKTGLPLADTHYVLTGAKNKCFVYVYELDEEKSMLLLKTDDETAEEIANKYPMFVKSRFPKSRYEQWYTLIPHNGFNSADEVFDVIALILSKYTENLRKVSQEVRQEIARLKQIKKSNVTAEEAKELVSDAAASVLVTGKKHKKTGKKFEVNIDTLSARYDADDVVNLESLKEKGIVAKSVKQVKILARGILDKPLTVIADDFSADAVKMIVLTGGEALWS